MTSWGCSPGGRGAASPPAFAPHPLEQKKLQLAEKPQAEKGRGKRKFIYIFFSKEKGGLDKWEAGGQGQRWRSAVTHAAPLLTCTQRCSIAAGVWSGLSPCRDVLLCRAWG